MGYQDPTEMGGPGQAFLTTHWTLIDEIKSGEDRDRALIGLLLERYWKPVYCYLRRKGYGNEDAKDLTQGFLHEVVLNRGLVQKAEQSRALSLPAAGGPEPIPHQRQGSPDSPDAHSSG